MQYLRRNIENIKSGWQHLLFVTGSSFGIIIRGGVLLCFAADSGAGPNCFHELLYGFGTLCQSGVR
jgi:hypothetical protein